MKIKNIIFTLILLFNAGSVYSSAAISSIYPNVINQTSIIEITVAIPAGCPPIDESPPLIAITQNNIRLDMNHHVVCVPISGTAFFTKSIGPLDVGTYNIQLFSNGTLDEEVQIQVSHLASIPTFNYYGLFSLIISLMLVVLMYRKKMYT